MGRGTSRLPRRIADPLRHVPAQRIAEREEQHRGLPTLTITALLEPGYPFVRRLEDAAPGALGLTWVSQASMPFDVLGGTLHAFLKTAQFAFVTDASGSSTLGFTWPAGIPSGIELTIQDLVQDVSAPAGITLSNAVSAVTP